MRRPLARSISLLAVTAATLGAGPVASAAIRHDGDRTPTFDTVTVGAYGGEPSLAAGPTGELYETTPSGGTVMYKSTDRGESWKQTATADPNSGDDCVSTDQAGSIYLCNLAGSPSTAPLQADMWKSTDDGAKWQYGNNTFNQTAGQNVCGTSCNPFGVDRDWADAYIPRGGNTDSALVVMMYHDFYGPSQIWVNVSTDGGKDYGQSQDILTHLNTSGVPGGVVAQLDSACNTVPIGLRIVKSGRHAGRIYAAWIASDPESLAEGCNLSQAEAFHNLFVAWSDDGGATWTPQLAYDAGLGHDSSTPFAAFTTDDRGNPYIAFTTQPQSADPATCSAEGLAGTVQSDTSCAYHTWVVWSHDGGTTWNGGGGVVPGSAANAIEVDPSSKPQTDVFPAIAAGDPGKVDVSWLGTNETEPTDPLGKFMPGGCAGPGPSNGNPPTYPAPCQWNLYGAQSLNLYAPAQDITWSTTQITPKPMHVGDICNLGIACAAPASNRNLLDFISEAVDPTTGYAHIAYPDDNTVNKLRAANQESGPAIISPRHHHHHDD